MVRILFSLFFCVLFTCCQPPSNKEVVTDKMDESLLDRVQLETFNYYWKGVEPISMAARERIHMDNIYPAHPPEIITVGASGFALMATIVGVERGFVSREEALERMTHVIDFFEKADRFHGAWPHWLLPNGKMTPFSKFDNGGDLVETAFLIQGMLSLRQYFNKDNEKEKKLRDKITKLWEEVEWSWYTKGGEKGLYWHWSPEYEWKMNFKVHGYNECLIMYILAASSPTYPIEKDVYTEGYMLNGKLVTDSTLYDIPVVIDHYNNPKQPIGPMFWAQYSYLGLDPRNLKDEFVDFWKLNVNHTKIIHKHSVVNPYEYEGYSDSCWGLTSSYSMGGYKGHNPTQDYGVISPTAALASFPYLPEESYKFLEFVYGNPDLIGTYGPYDAFSFTSDWITPRYLGLDQLTIPVMIENYRTGLLWKLFMQDTDLQNGLNKLNFTYN